MFILGQLFSLSCAAAGGPVLSPARVEIPVANGGTVYLPQINNDAQGISPTPTPTPPPVIPAGVFHIPYSTKTNLPGRLHEAGVFWFGKITPWDNYTDIRLGYNDQSLLVGVFVIDRLLWRDESPAAVDLTQWDAVSVYLSTNGGVGSSPTTQDFKIVTQSHRPITSPPNPEAGTIASYRGNGGDWGAQGIPRTTYLDWESVVFPYYNDAEDDYGWSALIEIPFTSLGLSGPPAAGTEWSLAARVYDRDAEGGAAVETGWPAAFQDDDPASWGQVSFGLPVYTQPDVTESGSATIQHGLNGMTVTDGMAGGNSTCSDQNRWTAWGEANYAGAEQIFVQNQWEQIADWVCFSKLYITFPLDAIPAGQDIISATLTMAHFGNSLPEEAPASMVQVIRVDEAWNEATLNWNNAPLAVENVSRVRVEPLPEYFPGQQPALITWDMRYAVAQAYANGEDFLRLVLYEADVPKHTGKYFYSSETYTPAMRPTLHIVWGN
ncbi:MAG: DNRLRE domain-containing protein [Chloroflexi bacterium]|nr:DNRLRE domain-containing protein [Chloroflexota bacterium]